MMSYDEDEYPTDKGNDVAFGPSPRTDKLPKLSIEKTLAPESNLDWKKEARQRLEIIKERYSPIPLTEAEAQRRIKETEEGLGKIPTRHSPKPSAQFENFIDEPVEDERARVLVKRLGTRIDYIQAELNETKRRLSRLEKRL